PPGAATFTAGVASPASSFTTFRSGSNTLTATDAGATGVNGSVTSSVNASSASTIAVTSGSPQSATVNTAFTNRLTGTSKDAFGNAVSGVSVTFVPPGSGASGAFAGGVNTASTNASGLATSAAFTANT